MGGLQLLVVILLITAEPAFNCGNVPASSFKVVGGALALPYSWPWLAIICEQKWFECQLKCGASLIAPQWILTAAHCVTKKQKYRIKLGVYRSWYNSEPGEVVADIAEIYVHPHYSAIPTNDIALIKLDKAVAFTDRIQPVCLPSPAVANVATFGYIAGWGSTKFRGYESPVLREAEIPFRETTVCSLFYGSKFQSNQMICAGKFGSDSCQGDSGGPLVSMLNGSWYQYGIISFGSGCAGRVPGVNTRVSRYCDFIRRITGLKLCSEV